MHGHSHANAGADLRTAEGIKAAKWSSLGLLIAGGTELGIFALGDSAGLLADAIHNLGDVSTTIAIWIAFTVSKRQATERYPHGYHRVEDLAGLFVLIVMAASAVAAGYSSLQHLITGAHPTHLVLSAAAAIAGFAGNEIVAEYKVRTGRRIGSVSLEADGAHSRTDGLVSLAALAGIIGVAVGFERADGIAGVLITLVIIGVLVSTARGVLGRTLDAVDPDLTRQVRTVAASVPLVTNVHDVRVRWAGRALFVTLSISLPSEISLAEAHAAAEAVRHALLHEIENLREIDVHMDPDESVEPAHALTAHHRDATGGFTGADGHDEDDGHTHEHNPQVDEQIDHPSADPTHADGHDQHGHRH